MRPATHPRTSGSDHLGRYYTRNEISHFLVNQLVGISSPRVLDLGAGAGSLSLAAIGKWQDANLVTVDVDKRATSILNRELHLTGQTGQHIHVRADVLNSNLPEIVGASIGRIDIGVCNPPFIIPKWRKGFSEILEDAGFSGCLPSLKNVDAALLFLAQNLRLLGAGGSLGIILPDSLISSAKYKKFRLELLSRYCLEQVIRLPRCSFLNTDALAHILIIKKHIPSTARVSLLRLDEQNALSNPLKVSIDDAIHRMDFDYHSNGRTKNLPTHRKIRLEELSLSLKRGSLNSSSSKAASFPTFHTTDMNAVRYGHWCDLRRYGSKKSHACPDQNKFITASPGDILIGRVGRNLEWKVMGVSAGFPIITDCIMRLTVPKESRALVLEQLTSDSGREWLISRAYGVGAQQLSKADLLSFPVVQK